jgi:YidC/Oxa1 family membrane protein insertase
MLSTHLVYQKKAFDHFDTIFCVGNYQIEEIRNTENFYNLKPKNLVKFGYNHLDNLIKKYSKKENFLPI